MIRLNFSGNNHREVMLACYLLAASSSAGRNGASAYRVGGRIAICRFKYRDPIHIGNATGHSVE